MVFPTVNRSVHYVARGSLDGVYPPVCRAAIVTEVDQPDNLRSPVGLCVLNPTGLFFNQHVPYGPSNEPGTWHWAEPV